MYYANKTIVFIADSTSTATIPIENRKNVPEFENWEYFISHSFKSEDIGNKFLVEYKIDLLGNVVIVSIREYNA